MCQDVELNVLAGGRIESECDIPQCRTTWLRSPMPHSVIAPLGLGAPGCRHSCLGLDHLQEIFNLGDQRITKVSLDAVALTVLAPDVLQTLADSLTLLGVIRSNRTPEATHQTVLDVLLPSLIDDLQRRCDHLLLIHVIADIGPFPLELIDAQLRSPSPRQYQLRLRLAEPIVKRSVLISLLFSFSLYLSLSLSLYLSHSFFVWELGLTFPQEMLSRRRGSPPDCSHSAIRS